MEYDGDEKISLEPSTSGVSLKPSKKFFDLDNGIDEEYKIILSNNKLKLPSKVFENRLNPIDIINNVNKSIKSKSEYIIKNSTKKGNPLQKLKQEQKTRYTKYKKELPFLKNYVKRINDIKNAYDYIETSYIESKSKKTKPKSKSKLLPDDSELKSEFEIAQEFPLPDDNDDEFKSELEMAQELPLPDDDDIEEETRGEGIYTQTKRNAYKISQNGQYGGLVIDLPKLHGHLKVVAHKNGQKVYDKQADFDTLDLLTKRFNNRKNYSELARTIFNDLNRLSEIPIHRTSKKYSKLGSGVVYYNNPQDLLSRLELLGGSMSAGSNSSDVREEFVNIVHMLNKLNVINNNQVNDLLKNYLM